MTLESSISWKPKHDQRRLDDSFGDVKTEAHCGKAGHVLKHWFDICTYLYQHCFQQTKTQVQSVRVHPEWFFLCRDRNETGRCNMPHCQNPSQVRNSRPRFSSSRSTWTEQYQPKWLSFLLNPFWILGKTSRKSAFKSTFCSKLEFMADIDILVVRLVRLGNINQVI